MRTDTAPHQRRRRPLLVLATAVALTIGGLGWPSAASAAVGVPVTYPGHVYGTAVTTPTEDKPQSKLWYHDGSWWALMVVAGGTEVHIHRLQPDHTWTDTGTLVDDRVGSTGDALWSSQDNRLYVASRVTGTGTGAQLQVRRFSYDTTTDRWAVDPGFPVAVATGGGSESATIDQDTTGRLWVTWTRGSRVWVSYSTDQGPSLTDHGATWAAPFNPNVPDTTITSDDISAVIAFGSSVGILWSDQGTTTSSSPGVRFAIHDNADPVTTWRVENALSGAGLADDHINLKQLVGDPGGRVFAAVKTSADEVAGASPGDTLVGVLVRTPGAGGVGTWAMKPAGTLAQGWTRPMIMIDATNQELYFFATTGIGGPDIVYKKSPLSNVGFPTGNGALFLDAPFSVNNPAGAKDPVTAETGLVVLASSSGQHRYAHAEMQLAGGAGGGGSDVTAPTVTARTPAVGATSVAVGGNVTATFSEAVTGVDATTFALQRKGDTAAVPAVVSRNGTTNQWILDPSAGLAPDTRYVATLTGGTTAIRDAAGNPLATGSWEFLTGPAPKVTARTPAVNATGVSRTANVTATFSEAVLGLADTTFTLRQPDGQLVAAPVLRDGTTNRWILDPSPTLAANTKYTVTLTGGANAIRDAAGNPLAKVTWSFTTGA